MVLAACGIGAGGGEQPDVPVPTVTSATSGPIPPVTLGAAGLPLDVHSGTDAQNDVIDRAVGLLTQECMRAKGFDYAIPENGSAGRGDRLRKGGYGITDRAQAALHGYRDPNVAFVDSSGKVQLPPGMREESPQEQEASYLVALRGAVDGPLTDDKGRFKPVGCLYESLYKIYDYQAAESRADLDLPGRLAAEANDRAARHPQVTAGVAAWSECMRAKGFNYANPQEPLNATWSDKSAEVATALADIACKEHTGLVTTWLSAISGYQHELIDRNASALAELKKINDEQVKRAEQVLAGR